MIPLEAARRRRRRLWIREPLSWPLERRVSLLLGAINLSPALAVKCSQTLELPRSVLAGRCAFGSVSARLPHSVWLPIDKRDLCRQQIDRELLRGRRCRGGVDLRRRPTSRRLLRFDPTDQDPKWRVLPFFFIRKTRSPFGVNATACPTTCGSAKASFKSRPAPSSITGHRDKFGHR